MPAPFVDQEFTFHDPDGSPIRVRGTGNQFHSVFETLDGYTVLAHPATHAYEYATVAVDGSLTPSGHRVGSSDPASSGLTRGLRAAAPTRDFHAAAAPTSGSGSRWEARLRQRRAQVQQSAEANKPHAVGLASSRVAPPPVVVGLCLMVQFPNDTTTGFTKAQIEDFCNKVGYSEFGNKGSIFDYYQDVSEKRLSYTNIIVDYFTAANDRSYYDDSALGIPTRARELAVEGLDHLKASGFDFSRLTVDADNFVYALSLFYTGTYANYGKGLTPHQTFLAKPYQVDTGQKFSDYQITNMGTELTIGTFAHESGHLVCSFPDLYNRENLDSHGVGGFCLMGYFNHNTDGDKNPAQVSGYLKSTVGWTTRAVDLKPGAVETVDAGVNDFLFYRKNATEYFLIENRQQQGRDAGLPDAGALIWHVDEGGTNQTDAVSPGLHYELSVVQADGEFQLEVGRNYGDDKDLWGDPKVEFSEATIPNSKWWNLTRSGLEIVEMSAPATRMFIRTAGKIRLALPAFGYDQGGWRIDRHVRLLADVGGNPGSDIVGFADDGVWVARSTGDGTFTGPERVVADFGYDQGWRVDKHLRVVADISGTPGVGDLVGFGDHGVLVYPNKGDGTFGEIELAVADLGYIDGGWRTDKHVRFARDITADGRADLLGFGEHGVVAYLNNGDGTFGELKFPIADFCFDKGWRIDRHPRFLADVTGSGLPDLVGFFNDGVHVATNNGDGSFGGIQKVSGEFGYDAGWRTDKHPRFLAPIFQRASGSTVQDIVGFFDDGVRVAFNQGNGTFAPSKLVLPNFGFVAGHWKVSQHPRFLADLTGDGTADIVGFGSEGVWVSLNDGHGKFAPLQKVVPNFGSSAGNWQVDKHPRLIADLTGSGRGDIAGFGFDGVYLSMNNGRGRF